jgi:hypothetical protein
LLEIEGAEHDSVDKIEQHGFELVRFLQQRGFAPPPGEAFDTERSARAMDAHLIPASACRPCGAPLQRSKPWRF